MIKSYTSLEQSKQLAKFLPLESADMYYDGFGRLPQGYAYTLIYPNSFEYDKPCWSLAALLEILPYPQLSKDKLGSGNEGWMVSVYPNDCRYDSLWHNNQVDACVEMILKLHELNLL